MRKLTIALIVLMLTVSTTAFAQRGRRTAGQGNRQAARQQVQLTDEQKAVLEAAKLTDEQREQVRALRTEVQKTRVKIQADLKIAKIELTELRSVENISDSRVRSQLEKIKGYEVDLQMENFKHKKAVDSILSDEQKEARQKLAKFRKARGIRRGMEGRSFNRRSGRGGMGMGMRGNAIRRDPGDGIPMQGRFFERGIGDEDDMNGPGFKMFNMMHGDEFTMHDFNDLKFEDIEWMADIDWLFDEYTPDEPVKKSDKDRL